MKRYGVFHALVMSLFSKDLYRDVAANWKGIGGLYLLLLTILTVVPLAMVIQHHVGEALADDTAPVIDQIPPIVIEDGRLSADCEPPYVIVPDPDDPESPIVAVIDTTGQTTSLDQTDAYVLVTATHIHHREGETKTVSNSFAEVPQFQLDRDKVHGWAQWIHKWLWVFVGPALFVFFYVARLLLALVAALLALIVAAMANRKLSFAALMRLSAVAITPAVIFSTVLACTSLRVPSSDWICFGIGLIYVVLAALAMPRREPEAAGMAADSGE